MWVFTQKGFFSIVRDYNNEGNLLVRSRVRGDIEKLWPTADVERTPSNDYMYRVSLPMPEVARVIANVMSLIEYTNYKASIEDKRRREEYYAAVWSIMATLQADTEV